MMRRTNRQPGDVRSKRTEELLYFSRVDVRCTLCVRGRLHICGLRNVFVSSPSIIIAIITGEEKRVLRSVLPMIKLSLGSLEMYTERERERETEREREIFR